MEFTVSQVKCTDRGVKLSEMEYMHFTTYQAALKFYNLIKDDESKHNLKEKEYICTQLHNDKGSLLELHKHRKYIKYYK